RAELDATWEAFLAHGQGAPDRRRRGGSDRRHGLLVLGDVGSGKSTWVARLARRLQRSGTDDLDPRGDRRIVVLVRGSELLREDPPAGRLLRTVLRRLLLRDDAFDSWQGLFAAMDERLRDDDAGGRAVFLLVDGLDEVPELESGLQELRALLEAASARSWVRVVATGAPSWLRSWR
ncbi:MAG: AAA family ATPase, partial [Proteobacteria bacterium]|nr:AAA family ATPase [Pseudomonadota bacterium]